MLDFVENYKKNLSFYKVPDEGTYTVALFLYSYFVGYMLVCSYAIKISLQGPSAWGNEKDLTPRTGRIFRHGVRKTFPAGGGGRGNAKKLMVDLKNFPVYR
jgi:hypothetical protein